MKLITYRRYDKYGDGSYPDPDKYVIPTGLWKPYNDQLREGKLDTDDEISAFDYLADYNPEYQTDEAHIEWRDWHNLQLRNLYDSNQISENERKYFEEE